MWARLYLLSVNAAPSRLQRTVARYSWLMPTPSADRLHVVGVLLLAHEAVELGGVRKLQLEEPAAPRRLLVHGAGRPLERRIDRGDLARDRGIDLACRLDALDDRRLAALGDAFPDRRKLDIDDVAELALGVVGDADGAGVALDPDVLVVLGVARRHSCLPPSSRP